MPVAFVAYFPSLYILDKEDDARAAGGLPVPLAARRGARRLRRRPCLAARRAPLPERRWLSAVIEVEEVEKQFVLRAKKGRLRRERRVVDAVHGISFAIERGTMVGYLGPNGAGKSTTVKMLTGILVPSAGRIRVAGLDPSRQRIELARRIGVVFGQRSQLWWDLPLRGLVRAAAPHLPRPGASGTARTSTASREVLELGPFLATPVRQLSLGQRMRGELAAALLHDPEIVFLDEPTIGLDVVAKAAVREFLAEVNRERGVTVLLTTHDLADIERLCSRLLIIDHGRLIWDGGLDELKRRYGPERTLVVDLEEPAPPLDVPGARVVRVDGPRQWLVFRRDETSAAELTAAVAARARLVDLAIEETEIEEIVRRIYAAQAAPPAS